MAEIESPLLAVRVRWSEDQPTPKVTARNLTFAVEGALGFHPTGSHPAAVEMLLGALGADLIGGLARFAVRYGVDLYALEAAVSGRLEKPLVALGVVGEVGNPGFAEITCTVYASADAAEEVLTACWRAARAASPIANTLDRGGVVLHLTMQVVP